MAFAMMMHAGKPKTWWHWAFDWATYVLDRCPRRSNENSITPFEVFFGSKPDLAGIRIFGCICFPLVLPSQHKHLTPRAQRGVFVGVDEERRGYRVVLSMHMDGMHTYIYMVARSVTFYEQSLVDAMRINIGKEPSDWELMDVHANGAGSDLKLSDMTDISAQRLGEVDARNSSTGSSSDSKAQPKLSDIDGRTSLVSSQQSLVSISRLRVTSRNYTARTVHGDACRV